MKKEVCSYCGSLDTNYENIDGELFCLTCVEQLFVDCKECGSFGNKLSYKEFEGYYYCEDCFNDNFVECSECDEVISVQDAIEVGYNMYCSYCVNEHTVTCDRCGSIVHNDDAHSDILISVCDDCYHYYYATCYECGCITDSYTEYDGDIYCENCTPNFLIRSYEYKPDDFNFLGSFEGSGELFMGVELEVDDIDGHRSRTSLTKILYEECNSENRFYFKNDGSLDNGFEIVTHPMTLEYHMKKTGWKNILNIVSSEGFQSHDAGTCGLHVHLSKSALGKDSDEIDETTMKILFFVERFWNYLVKFSRRTSSKLNEWAKPYGLQGSPKRLLDHAKGCERYYAVNLTNKHTVEIRIFRGTLSPTTFMATLQFCHEMVRYCKSKDITELLDSTWTDFIDFIYHYDELFRYLESRDLLSDTKEVITSSSQFSYNDIDEDDECGDWNCEDMDDFFESDEDLEYLGGL